MKLEPWAFKWCRSVDWADITAPQMRAVIPCLSHNEFSSAVLLKAYFLCRSFTRVSANPHTSPSGEQLPEHAHRAAFRPNI